MSMVIAEIYRRMAIVAHQLRCQVLDLQLSAGAALVLHGLRSEFDDLDLTVPKRVWEYALQTGVEPVQVTDTVQLIPVTEWADIHFGDTPKNTQIMYGMRVYTLEELLVQKQALAALPGRKPEKVARDLREVDLIRGALKKR